MSWASHWRVSPVHPPMQLPFTMGHRVLCVCVCVCVCVCESSVYVCVAIDRGTSMHCAMRSGGLGFAYCMRVHSL